MSGSYGFPWSPWPSEEAKRKAEGKAPRRGVWGFLSQSALGLSVVVLTVSLVAAFLAVIAYTSYDANATRREARNARQEVVAAQKKRTDDQAKAAQASTTTTEPAGDPM